MLGYQEGQAPKRLIITTGPNGSSQPWRRV